MLLDPEWWCCPGCPVLMSDHCARCCCCCCCCCCCPQALATIDTLDVQQCLQLLSAHTELCGQALQQALGLAMQAARAHATALQQAGRRCFDHGVRQALAHRDMHHAEQVGVQRRALPAFSCYG